MIFFLSNMAKFIGLYYSEQYISYDIQILITPLISSNSSYVKSTEKSLQSIDGYILY